MTDREEEEEEGRERSFQESSPTAVDEQSGGLSAVSWK
jgi:hypothetical protein